jgi:hypothetical protein
MSFRLPVATHQFLFLGQEDVLPSIAEHEDITSEISMKLPSKRYTMAHISYQSALFYLTSNDYTSIRMKDNNRRSRSRKLQAQRYPARAQWKAYLQGIILTHLLYPFLHRFFTHLFPLRRR